MELEILRSREAVAQILPAADSLARTVVKEPNATYTPDYFLPRMGTARSPRVVACYEDRKLIGVLYAEERCFFGFRTGFVFGGDFMGRGLVLASPEREAEVVATACDRLLATGVHAIRFYWRGTGREATPLIPLQSRDIKVWCRSQYREEGDWLTLAPSYEQFLARLGAHTRRNFRYYRKKAEELGYSYDSNLSPAEYHAAIKRLNRIADYPIDPKRGGRDQRFFEHFRRVILAGLRNKDGEVVSALGGVASGHRLHVLTQLNDQNLRKLSISLVLRGYLIEELIGQDFSSIHFVNGASAMLGRFCDPVLMRTLHVDSTRSVMHLVKRISSTIARELERRGKGVPDRLKELVGSYMNQ